MTIQVKFFVINLDDRRDRLENCLFQLFSIGVTRNNITRVPAVDTRKASYESLLARFPAIEPQSIAAIKAGERKQGHHELTSGAVGCYFSHMLAYRMIVEMPAASSSSSSGDDIAVIVEDDISVVDKRRLVGLIGNLCRAFKDGTEIFFIGHIGISYMYLGLHCYAIQRKTARKLLEILPAPRMQLDWQFHRFEEAGLLRTAAAKKRYIAVLDKDSDIQADQPCNASW